MTPQEMDQAIIKNLAVKTGRALFAWFEILDQTGLTDQKSMNTLLKTGYNVGHFQTQAIAKCYLNRTCDSRQ